MLLELNRIRLDQNSTNNVRSVSTFEKNDKASVRVSLLLVGCGALMPQMLAVARVSLRLNSSTMLRAAIGQAFAAA